MTILSPRQQVFAFRAVMFSLVVAAGVTFLPLWAPLVLATWVAVIARPLVTRVARVTRGRDRAAGAVVLALVMAILVPIGIALVSLTRGAADLGKSLIASHGVKNGLITIVSGGQPAGESGALDAIASPQKIIALVQEHGAQAAQLASGIASTAAEALLALFIFLYAVYVFLVDGPAYYDWFEKHAPIEIEHTRRLVAAFNETGRGLFVSVGLTGLAQGIVATITYFALGVPCQAKEKQRCVSIFNSTPEQRAAIDAHVASVNDGKTRIRKLGPYATGIIILQVIAT